MVKERISGLEDISIDTPKTEKQKEQKLIKPEKNIRVIVGPIQRFLQTNVRH